MTPVQTFLRTVKLPVWLPSQLALHIPSIQDIEKKKKIKKQASRDVSEAQVLKVKFILNIKIH